MNFNINLMIVSSHLTELLIGKLIILLLLLITYKIIYKETVGLFDGLIFY